MSQSASQLARLSAWLLVACLMTACGARYLESPVVATDTRIERTDEREAILVVMEDYVRELAALNVEGLRALISEDYYENNGTTHTTDDDYGYQGVLALFETLKKHVADVRVRVAVREINVRDDRADVLFDYEYTMLYRVQESERWSTQSDVNRIEMRNEDGIWRITSGL